jgi:hypothetical protein
MPRYGSGKDTTCSYKKIDARFLQKNGYLNPGRYFTLSWQRNEENVGSVNGRTTDTAVILSYTHRSGGVGEWKQAEYPIWISHTPCHYGGQRPWLHCPARGCGRRVAILYGEQSLLAVTAISWHMRANAKETLNAPCAVLRPSRSGSGVVAAWMTGFLRNRKGCTGAFFPGWRADISVMCQE